MSRGIQKIFSEVPRTYELVNHLLTFGLDVRWRTKAARIAARGGGARWIDVCSGTGETAAGLSRLAGEHCLLVAADFSFPMLMRAALKPEARRIAFTLADARNLPFRDGSFDLVTMSFATRNINVDRDFLLGCFREFHRILKPGGRFVNLETSQPGAAWIRRLFHIYVRLTVRPVGRLLSGSRTAYAYLAHTIPRFYGAGHLSGILGQAGFSRVAVHPLLFGAAAIHEAEKQAPSSAGGAASGPPKTGGS
jgi:demethylmenaquinone methyltransferase/2-methoxy-6-polyprenyl-1,4-benzoquinol methylase